MMSSNLSLISLFTKTGSFISFLRKFESGRMYLSQSFKLSLRLVSYSFIIKEAMNFVKLNL
jgi:hypothetical protein